MKAFGKTFTLKDSLAGFGVLSLLLAIPITVIVAQQNNQIQSQAAIIVGSSKGPPCTWLNGIGNYGDVDNDHYVTSKDASLVLQMVSGTLSANDFRRVESGDVGGPTKKVSYPRDLDSTDANLILQYASGSINNFPACGGKFGSL